MSNDPNVVLMLFYIFGALIAVAFSFLYFASKKSKR